ncbi:MAG: hypothetical protein QOJ62_967 [Actinomycetota bacterium]|nr:hypothetical protein [Actinomycetota bacterium]
MAFRRPSAWRPPTMGARPRGHIPHTGSRFGPDTCITDLGDANHDPQGEAVVWYVGPWASE